MKEKRNNILKLFLSFFKIGALSFGGGYAMIPHIQEEVADKRKWITEEELLEIISIAESTPGPIAINSATFIGKKVAGFWGAFFATLGVVLPSFVIISVIAYLLQQFNQYKPVKYAFFGIRAGVLACIVKSLYMMFKKCPKGIMEYILMAAALAIVAFLKIKAIYVIIACGLIGLAVSLIAGRRKNAL